MDAEKAPGGASSRTILSDGAEGGAKGDAADMFALAPSAKATAARSPVNKAPAPRTKQIASDFGEQVLAMRPRRTGQARLDR
jgi:hypothetical protein